MYSKRVLSVEEIFDVNGEASNVVQHVSTIPGRGGLRSLEFYVAVHL
jgi:hypothetical protein